MEICGRLKGGDMVKVTPSHSLDKTLSLANVLYNSLITGIDFTLDLCLTLSRVRESTVLS